MHQVGGEFKHGSNSFFDFVMSCACSSITCENFIQNIFFSGQCYYFILSSKIGGLFSTYKQFDREFIRIRCFSALSTI